MQGLLLALLGTFLAGLGARDQMLVAHLCARSGRHGGLLALALACAALTAGLAAWAGNRLIGDFTYTQRLLLAALALGVGGLEMLALSPRKVPAEPTRSLGAAGIVLLAEQVTDTARLLVLAVAVACPLPLAAGLGGALGGAASVALGWQAGEALIARARPLGWGRRAIGALLLLAAIVLAMWLRAPYGAG